jgi:hypothetical protein
VRNRFVCQMTEAQDVGRRANYSWQSCIYSPGSSRSSAVLRNTDPIRTLLWTIKTGDSPETAKNPAGIDSLNYSSRPTYDSSQ